MDGLRDACVTGEERRDGWGGIESESDEVVVVVVVEETRFSGNVQEKEIKGLTKNGNGWQMHRNKRKIRKKERKK